MIQEIPGSQVPDWIPQYGPLDRLPLLELLSGSVYYPASGFDGQPVKILAGNFHSFVYVDYGLSRDQLLATLRSERGFLGYGIVALRDVTEQELIPNGWTPLLPNHCDGNPRPLQTQPFSVWVVLKRQSDFNEEHGPMYFSLLYICGDGVATYQAIYLGNKTYPAVVAIIQPGTGFGGNWTNFEDPQRIFGRTVMGNPDGVPTYLLYGGWAEGHFYTEPCWPQYSELVWNPNTRLRLWRRPN